jgi:hypothetical protein
MDVAGAKTLKERIDARQRRHWRQARAVRAGLQAGVDPDAEHLVRCADDLREYEPRPGRRYVKQLVDGRWEAQNVPSAP